MTEQIEVNTADRDKELEVHNASYIESGFLPTNLWKATDINGRLLLATQNIQDFKDQHLHNKTGVTIIRNYVKTENTWIREDPFPEETAGKKALSPDEVIKFFVDGLGVRLEAWQEELLRQRVVNPDKKLNLFSKGQ